MGRRRLKPKKSKAAMPEKYTEYVVERICDKKIKNGVVYYYIKWEGYPDEENSWEPVENCKSAKKLIKEYEKSVKKSTSGNDQKKHSESNNEAPAVGRKKLKAEVKSVFTGSKYQAEEMCDIGREDSVEVAVDKPSGEESLQFVADVTNSSLEAVPDPEVVQGSSCRRGRKRKHASIADIEREENAHVAVERLHEVRTHHNEIGPEDEKYRVCNGAHITSIYGITRIGVPELRAFVRYADGSCELVPTRVLAVKEPALLIRYYEKNIHFRNASPDMGSISD